jgi:hypothetical protein
MSYLHLSSEERYVISHLVLHDLDLMQTQAMHCESNYSLTLFWTFFSMIPTGLNGRNLKLISPRKMWAFSLEYKLGDMGNSETKYRFRLTTATGIHHV